jgi:multisubunit Na+/H+ antiporter MnhC subunit
MKKFIKNNWILLVLGIINLCFSAFMPFNKILILNAFVAGACLTAFTLGCIYTYYEEKYKK